MYKTLIPLILCIASFSVSVQANNDDIAELSLAMFSVQGQEKAAVVEKLLAVSDESMIPTFVLAMRFTGSNIYVAKALSQLTGEEITHWHEAYQWQERRPDIVPHESFRALKLRFLGNTDAQFKHLLEKNDGTLKDMKIRLEEIVWGGVLFDGIASLDNATMIKAEAADYLLDDDLVFGVEINGDVRAYPLRIMGWHEMVNDVVGGVPVALAYCTLCASGILFETAVDGMQEPLIFGSSGLLYRSNKLMFDRTTQSLWSQFSGEPVVGDLVGSDIKLKVRPITITDWQTWQEQHPTTTVLSLDTGFIRNYDSGVTYKDYFASSELMFPAFVNDESEIKRKDYIFGVRGLAASKAWPLTAFEDEPVINDAVGRQPVVLIGDNRERTVRAYQRQSDDVFWLAADGTLINNNESWSLTEAFLISSDGRQKRARVPGHVSYWFAWENFLGFKSELYTR